MRRQSNRWDDGLHPAASRGRPLRRRRRPLRQHRRSWVRMAGRAFAVVAALLLVVGVGLGALLVTGPTDVGLVRDQVVQVLRNGLGDDYRVTTGPAVIGFDRLIGGLVIRVDDIEVFDRADNVVASVPTTRLRVNALALLTLRVEVNAIEIDRAEIQFVRLADSSVRLGSLATPFKSAVDVAAPPTPIIGPDGGFPDLVGPLQILDRGIEPPVYAAVRAGFTRLSLNDAAIVVADQAGGREQRFDGSNVGVDVDPRTARVKVDFDTLGHSGRWSASFDRSLGAAGEGHQMTAVFSELTVADLFPGLGGQGPLSADIPLYGRASFDFDAEGEIESATARLDLGAGLISFAQGTEEIRLDEGSVNLRWDVADRAVIVEDSPFYFGETKGSVSGRIQAVGEGADLRYDYAFSADNSVFAPGDIDLPPLVARRFAVSGMAIPATRVLKFDEAVIQADEGSISAVGKMGFDGETPSLSLAASISPMSVETLARMWTPLLAHGARRWTINNMVTGRILGGTVETDIPSGILFANKRQSFGPDQLLLNARFEDAEFKTFGEVPNIHGAAGNIVLSGNTFGVDITDAVLTTTHGDLEVEVGAFAIPDTSEPVPSGVIEVQVSGPAKALGAVAAAEPMNALATQDLTPDDLSGSGRASISVRMPLQLVITEEDVDWHVVVNTEGVAVAKPFEGRNVSDARVEINATPGEVTVYGAAQIDGVAADVSMAFPTTGAQAAPGARLVRVVLDDAARKKLGIGLENMLSGSVTALVSDAENGGQHYELDLVRARLTLPGMGWTKGVGVPASMSFDIRAVEDGHEVTNLILRGDGFGFHGTAKLDPTYALAEADIAHLALREGDSLAIRIIRGSSGYAVNARGESFNLQGLITQVRDEFEESGNFPDLALNADIDRVVGFNQQAIQNVSVRMVSVGGDTQKLSFHGQLGGDVSLEYKTGPDGQVVSGYAADSGRLMRFTDFYDRVVGGVARLSGQGPENGDLAGLFEVIDFRVLNEPAMERVVLNTADGTPAFDPGQVVFKRLVARYRRNDRLLTIEEALLRGPQVGATFAGRYDIPSTNVTLTGTYLPAYSLNNLFGQIPILGLVVGGGGREGLIGVTFKVEGPISGPDILFNPISAVAPGIFRRIFEFQ